jgi:hypothetical protein
LASLPIVKADTFTSEINALYSYETSLSMTDFETFSDHNITDLFWQAVTVGNDSSINLRVSGATINSVLVLGSTYGINVWLWVGTYPHDASGQVDISTEGARTTLIDNIMVVMNTYNFYGCVEDIEDLTASSVTSGQKDIRYVWFANNLTVALHAQGQKSLSYVPAVWSNFNTLYLPYMSGQDYLQVVPVYSDYATWESMTDQFLANTDLDCTFGIGYGATDIDWIDTYGLPSELVGFVIYCYDTFVWSEWDAWSTKNYYTEATPTPSLSASPVPTVDVSGYQPYIKPDHLVQGDSFNILIEYQGGLAFQHDNLMFYIEVLDGVWDGRDCQLSMNERGGTLYFMSYNDCHIELYQDSAYTMGLTCEGMEVDSVNPAPTATGDFYKAGYEWNGTITNGAEVRISWYFPRILPHEENWMLYLGLAGLFMLVIGILLTVYAFRHYKFFTLGDETTVWERDVLPIAIVLILIGGGLLITWLLG